ncbi:MAG TPA: peptidase MA family metallohydrolase [Promineifilum sp.]|nr:peptidase MA family metallohydrolase [Promineifilum sp.]HRO23206.1 peptidase MA family metallohydrolase [Promineifilum sp.]HRQ13403.1 peptidase MA family metallohydrolase [Promineifilum sp.]
MITPALRTLSFYAFLFAALFSPLWISPVLAQDEQIRIQSRADYIYGQSMNFHLLAENLGEIETATLFIRLGTSPDSFAVDIPVEVGKRIELSYELDLTQTRLPPFGSITYWWDLDRVGDSTIRVPEQIISYVDDQFSWRQLVTTDEQGGGSVRIHWTGENESLGELARNLTFGMLPEIGRFAPITQILPFDVYIYPSSADLSSALRLAGRDYQPGETFPDLGVVLLSVVNPETAESELRSGLSIGLTDLLLYQAMNQSAYNVPAWLRYGIAGIVRGRSDAVAEDSLISAIVAGETLPISELCSGTAIEDSLMIAQSESVVRHIIATDDENAVRDLVVAFAQGKDCPTALRSVIQLTPEQLESSWLRANSGNQSSRTAAEIGVWLVLVLAGFGLAGLLLLRPRR